VQTIAVHLTIKAVPYVEASDVTVATSARRVVQLGDPISAGDQLTVTVKAFDAERIPISRSDLDLHLQLKGKLNTIGTQLPLKLADSVTTVYNPITGRNESSKNVYMATVPEDWIRSPEAVQLIISSGATSEHNMTLTIVESSVQVLITGSVAGGIAAVLLIATLYLLYKHGTKAKSIVVSMVQGEAKTAWGCSSEAFDLAGDAAIFLAITKDAQSPIHSVSALVAPIAVPVMVAFSLSAVISAISLVTRGYFAVVQCRRRRRDISTIGSTQRYADRLATKIENGERAVKLAGLGLALAICEDLPMAGIAIYFFRNTYEVPLFNVISLVTSGLMLGMKVAPVMTFPAQWAKLNKWKGRVQPRCEAAEPGTELCETTREPESLTMEQYLARLAQLQAVLADLVTASSPALVAGDKLEFQKWAHKLTIMVNKAEEGPNVKPKAGPAADPLVPP
jgi:hypothetical protein